MITKELLLKVCPKSDKVSDIVVRDFNNLSEQYQINTPKRVAAFIAQCAHESAEFTHTTEIASGSAYEGRKDLGNIYKGDGKKFKGRGYIMTTGRKNYRSMSNIIFGNNRLINFPTLLAISPYAMQSAMIFWKSRGLNELSDIQYFQTITKKINGGLNGFKERIAYYNILCKEFELPLYSYETRNIITPAT